MDRRKIISTLCGDNSDNNYHNCSGHLTLKCRRDKYCDLNHLSGEQVDYILSDIQDDIYLKACPGSGKTEVVGIKCAYEMSLWNLRASGMAILTFTNSAENELLGRVSAYYRKQPEYPHFLGTFTSWLHGYIANPFLYIETGHGANAIQGRNVQIIDSDCNSDFLKSFKTKYNYGNILHHIAANEFIFNPKKSSYQYCGKNPNGIQEFQRQLEATNYMVNDLKDVKRRLWKSGFFLYEDIEILTYQLLHRHPEVASLVSKRFPFIIVDECQDLSFVQLLVLEQLHKQGTILHFVGDLDQSIYGFRDIDPSDTKQYLTKNCFAEIVLSKNYRSNQDIVDVTGILINRTESIKGMVCQSSDTPLVALLYKKDQETLMIDKYIELVKHNKCDPCNCRIIVRNNSLRQRLQGNKSINNNATQNTIEDYAHVIYLQKASGVSDFQERIQLLSRAIQKTYFSESTHENKIKLYRPVELSEVSWRNVILDVQKALFQNQEVVNLDQTWDKWKNHLKKQLTVIDSPLICDREINNLRLRPGVKNEIVKDKFSEDLTNSFNNAIKIETIHSCKGMSLDSVLFVSSYKKSSNKGSGNYWKEWFPQYDNSVVSESNRLAYVAASRAKHMLALGIPNPTAAPISKEDIDYLKSCGFHIIEC